MDDRPVVDDAAFMENVREALVNGYDRCCARCGIGTAGDDMDMHMRRCPEYVEPNYARAALGGSDDQ